MNTHPLIIYSLFGTEVLNIAVLALHRIVIGEY
jgi:hypothetical protein